MVRIRQYQPRDAEPTRALFVAAVTRIAIRDHTPEQVTAWVSAGRGGLPQWHRAMSGRDSFVAVIDDEVVGFSDLAPDGYLDMLYVSPDHCGRGVAYRLLTEAEDRARAAGVAELYADVSLTARPFFERRGFRVEDVRHPVRDGVGFTNFRMRAPVVDTHRLG